MKKKDNHNSRRKFIKQAAVGVGAATGIGAAHTASSQPIIQELDETLVARTDIDVAVVGAGVSGTYAAARLSMIDLQAKKVPMKDRKDHKICKQCPRKGGVIDTYLNDKSQKTLSVRLYEYSGRVGGRLLSTPIEGVDGGKDNSPVGPLKYAEFGGFRFDRQMKIVWETALALKLEDEPFYFQDLTVESNNIVNVRGELYKNDTSYKGSYPNLSEVEVDILDAGLDLGNYITNLAFGDTLPNAIPGETYENPDPACKNVEKVTLKFTSPYPVYTVTFNGNYQKDPSLPNTQVDIPGGVNGFSFSFVRYHFAFNAGDWECVKAIAEEYEAAKLKAIVAGRPLSDWSWWTLKRHYLTQEAVEMLEDTSGYNEQGSTGSVETNIDENYYFSPKSGPLAEGDETGWRHIKKGYSAIPQQLFAQYNQLKSKGTAPDKSEKVVKMQLIAFTKPDNAAGQSGRKYKCLFYKRQQGPAASISGSEALYEYQKHLLIINTLAEKKTLTPEQSKSLETAKSALTNYELVYCDFLILSLPRRALDLIDKNNFFFGSQGVQKLLNNSVHDILAMRLFIAYPKAWWVGLYPYNNLPQDLNGSQYYPVGRTRTDLGIRQLYYWCYNKLTGTILPPDSQTPKNYADPDKPAVLLASYNNGDATRYWRAIQDGQPYDLYSGSQTKQAHLYNKASGGPEGPLQLNIRNPQAGGPRHGSQTMGIEAHKQILKLHGLNEDDKSIPLPYYVHYEDWSKDPWGAGWHSWKSGFSKEEYIPKIRKPLQDENVFIIGECYSNVQGWVQGALNAAEAMLQCELGLPWASWLTIDGIWLGQGTRWVETSDQDQDPNPCLNGVPLAPAKKK